MNRFLSLSLAALLTAGLATSCKDDLLSGGELNAGQTQDDGRTLWIGASIALPTEGRTRADAPGSTTDDDVKGKDNDLTNSNIDKETDDDGNSLYPDYEYGYDYENNVRNVLLVFANDDMDYVTHAVVSGISKTPQNLFKNGALKSPYADLYVLGEIKHDALVKAYGEGGVLNSGDDTSTSENKKIVYVFAFCNYTARMLQRFDALAEDPTSQNAPEAVKWYNWEGEVIEEPSPAGYTPLTSNSIWSPNSFLMSNAKLCTVEFPETLGDWDNYADKNSPFLVADSQVDDEDEADWRPIQVERVAARLDFKDGSNYEDMDGKKVPNTYPLWVDADGDGTINPKNDKNIISVTLNRMCLVNMSKNYHYLRRVSADGTDKYWAIGGAEKSSNYVVDYDWNVKQQIKGITVKNEHQYFNFPLYTDDVENADAGGEATGYAYNRFGWYTDRIQEDFFGNNPSDDTWQNDPANDKFDGSGYKIWRYVTENTIPQAKDGSTDQQKTVQSTGIVFKGRIVAGRDIEKDTYHQYMSEKVKDAIQYINGDKEMEGGKTFGEGKTSYEALTDAEKELVPYLYSYNNILYAGHEELIERANADGNNGPLHHVANQILAHWVLKDAPQDFTPTHNPKNGKVTKVYMYKEEPESGDESMTVEAWAKINKKDSKGEAEPEYFLVKDADGKEVPEYRDYAINMDDFIQHAPDNDVTVYRPYNEDEKDINGNQMGDGWGYYCYYFYWNRHNDNSKGGLMGPMEFSTVRNNVYKLAVTSISRLGHPRNTDHDPDPVDPEDPDEDPTNYIKVQVNVLPWVVRVNNIEF